MRIPGIYVVVRGDISQLNADLGEARTQVRAAANDISDAMGNALNPNQITSGLNKITTRFTELSSYSKIAGQAITAFGGDLGQLTKMTGLAEDQFKSLQSRFLEVQAVKTAEKALKDMGSTLNLSAREVKEMGEQFNLSAGSIKKVQEALGGATTAGKGFGQIIENTFLYGSAYRLLGAIQELPGAILAASAKMEALRVSFNGIFGNEEGPKQFAYAGEMARRYGKDIEELSASYRKFSAAADFMGVSGDTTKRVFEAVTEAITKTGGTSEDVSTSLGALEHMLSKGTVTAEVFRRQFASHIPGAMKIGAEAMGVTTAEFNRMMKAGEIASMDLIPRLVEPLEKMAQGWEKSADTLLANTARLKNDMKTLADSHYIQEWSNNAVKFLDDVVQKTEKVANAFGNLVTITDQKNLGVASDDGSVAGRAAGINNVASMDDADKIAHYNRRLSELADERAKTLEKFYSADSFDQTWLLGGTAKGATGYVDAQIGNLEKLKTNLNYVMQLKDALAEAERQAGKGIDVKVNSERADWLAKLLSEFTNTVYVAHIKTEVNIDPLLSAMALIDRLSSKSAEGKLAVANKELSTLQDPSTLAGLQAKLESAQRTLRAAAPGKEADLASEAAVNAAEDIKNLPNATAEARKAAADAAKQMAEQTQSRVDPYFGSSPGEFLGLGDKTGARTSQYFSKFNKEGLFAKMLDPDPAVVQVARARWASLSQELADGIQKDKDAAAKKAMGAAKHNLQVERLGDTVDNYINKSLSGANNDPLGAKFSDIDQKAQSLISKAKELALQGGVSVKEFTDKIGPATEAAKELATQTQIESLFPYLKKDAAIQGFWNDVYFHYDKMDAAAKKLGTSVDEMWKKVSGVGVYKSDLNGLKNAMENSSNFAEFDKHRDSYNKKLYADNGDAERKGWADLDNVYDALSGDMEETRQKMYDRVVAKAKAAGLEESTAQRFATLQMDQTAKGFLDIRIGYEESFGAFLDSRLSQDLGLYKSAIGQQLAAWEDYYSALKGLAQAWGGDLKSGTTDTLCDLIVGDTKKAETSFKDMLSRMKHDVVKFGVDLGADWLVNNVVKPLVGGGTEGGNTPAGSHSASPYGLAGSQANLSAMLPAIQQYNLSGLIGGTSGAPSLISAFNAGGGGSTSSFFTGSGGSSSGSLNTPSWGSFSGASLSSDQQAQVNAISQQYGISPSTAAMIVLGGGSSGSTSGVTSSSAATAQSGSVFSLSNVSSAASLLKNGIDLTNGTGMIGSINAWGQSTLGIGSAAQDAIVSAPEIMSDGTVLSGNVIAPAVPGGAVGGLGNMLGSGAAAGGIGYLAGNMMSPQSPAAGYVGAGVGAATAVALSSSAVMGAVSGGTMAALAPLAATGYGAIIAVAAAAIMAAATPSVTTTTQNSNKGNTVDLSVPGGVMLMGHQPQMGFQGYTQNTTGSFGSSSTKHFEEPAIADPTLAKQWDAAMNTQTAGLAASLDALGMGTSSMNNFSFGAKFDVDSSNYQQASVNIANAMAEQAIQASNLSDAFNAALQPGESYIDEIHRVATSYAATNGASQIAGVSLATLSGSSNQVGQGDWASQVGSMLGGDANTTAAFTTIAAAMSKPAVAANTLGYTGSQADQAIGLINRPDVNRGNFWNEYSQAQQAGSMSPSDFQAWSNAATWMAQFNTAEVQAGQAIQQVNSLQIQGLQAQLQALQTIKVMVDGLNQSVSSAYSTYNGLDNSLTSTIQGLQWNSSLSPNTPTQNYQQQSAYWNTLKGNVASEDPSSVSYSQDIQKLTAFASTFLQTSKSYYGNSTQYQSDYQEVTGTLSDLKTPIDAQLEVLKAQLQAQDELTNSAQAQIDALNLANTQIQLTNTAIGVLGQDTVTGFNGLATQMSAISGVVANLQANYNMQSIGKAMGLPGFAHGGSFVVGENGVEVLTMGTGSSGTVTSNKSLQQMTDTSKLHRAINQGNQANSYENRQIHGELQKQTAIMQRTSRPRWTQARNR